MKEHRDEPFFVYLAHPMPHVPLFVNQERDGMTGLGLYADVIGEIDVNPVIAGPDGCRAVDALVVPRTNG